MEEGISGDGAEGQRPRSIFRCPHLELWDVPPADLHGPCLELAGLEGKEDKALAAIWTL